MNRTKIIAIAGVATALLMACSKPADNTASEGAQTGNPGQTTPANKTQDAVGAAVGETSAATLGSHDTGAFVSNASQSDMYEIQAAKIAQQRSKSAAVKDFAKMMVTQHTAMTNEMKPLITAAGKQPAASLDQRRSGFIDNLKGASDADFDKTYLDQQVAAHKEALTLMKGYGDDGPDAGLKAAAAKAATRVQQHLDKAQSLRDALK